MDVVKQSDVNKLYAGLVESQNFDFSKQEFQEVVQEVFGIWDDTEKENK